MRFSPLLLVATVTACAPSPSPATPPAATAPTAAATATPTPAPAAPFAVKVTGHGPPMLFIPGLASSGDVWDSTVEHVRDHFTCYVLTLPGFAGQPAVAGPLIPKMREAIAAYVTAAKLDHPIVVGHSLGGMLALAIAADHPDLFSRLVIVDSLPFLTAAWVPNATMESARAIADKARDGILNSPNAAENQRAMINTMVTKPADQATVLAWGRASDRATVADGMYGVMTTDLRDDVAKITAPTLVIGTWKGLPGGDHAGVAQVFDTQYAKLHGVKIAITDTARHFVMLDDPQYWLAQLDAFVAR
jgi:pimeloyl-ACP methyl ester carboxylesterase